MIKAMLIAGCGGFVGTCGRYLVGKWGTFALYLALSVICGILLVWAGRALIR